MDLWYPKMGQECIGVMLYSTGCHWYIGRWFNFVWRLEKRERLSFGVKKWAREKRKYGRNIDLSVCCCSLANWMHLEVTGSRTSLARKQDSYHFKLFDRILWVFIIFIERVGFKAHLEYRGMQKLNLEVRLVKWCREHFSLLRFYVFLGLEPYEYCILIPWDTPL